MAQTGGVLQHTESVQDGKVQNRIRGRRQDKSCAHHPPAGMFHPRRHWRSNGVQGTSHQSVLTNDSVRTTSIGALTASKCSPSHIATTLNLDCGAENHHGKLPHFVLWCERSTKWCERGARQFHPRVLVRRFRRNFVVRGVHVTV